MSFPDQYQKKTGNRIHKFECSNCKAPVSVDFSKVKRGYFAICRQCGTEFPFNESDERLVRKIKKSI
ncbi:hypothetical protein ACMC5R_11985 [Deferribacteres bacterium DY0037]